MIDLIGPPRFIVAEVSKTWIDGREFSPGSGLLAEQFEYVINHNDGRGYRLLTFQVHRQMTGPRELNETIFAVFEYVGPSRRAPEPDGDRDRFPRGVD